MIQVSVQWFSVLALRSASAFWGGALVQHLHFSTCFPSVAFSKTVFKTSVAISSSPLRFFVHAKYLISFVPLAISSSHHLTPSSGRWSPQSNPSFILQLASLDLNYSLLSPACPPACCFLWITRMQGWNPTHSFNTQTATHLQSNPCHVFMSHHSLFCDFNKTCEILFPLCIVSALMLTPTYWSPGFDSIKCLKKYTQQTQFGLQSLSSDILTVS